MTATNHDATDDDSPTNLAEKYPGVTAVYHNNPDEDLKLTGLSALKSKFRHMPGYAEDGELRKCGLTSDGHVAYRNETTDRLVYYKISCLGRHHDAECEPTGPRGHVYDGSATGRETEPRFGARWIIAPRE